MDSSTNRFGEVKNSAQWSGLFSTIGWLLLLRLAIKKINDEIGPFYHIFQIEATTQPCSCDFYFSFLRNVLLAFEETRAVSALNKVILHFDRTFSLFSLHAPCDLNQWGGQIWFLLSFCSATGYSRKAAENSKMSNGLQVDSREGCYVNYWGSLQLKSENVCGKSNFTLKVVNGFLNLFNSLCII